MINKYLLSIICLLISSYTYAQCYPDRHNTTWHDAWISCETKPSPNPELGEGHWIMYNFGRLYKLKDSHFWNTNDPDNTDYGFKELRIDYSVDGVEWQHYDNYTMARASGLSNYEGEQGPDFKEIEAQYVLITALNNYGGACYSLSEIKIDVEEVVISATDDLARSEQYCFTASITPNPFNTEATLEIKSNCTDPIFYSIIDPVGRKIINNQAYNHQGSATKLDGQLFISGIYFLIVSNGKGSQTYKFVKL